MVDDPNKAFSPDQLAVLEDFVEEAPNNPADDSAFGRKHLDWVPVLEDAPVDGTTYGRKDADWAPVSGTETDFGIGLTKDETATPPIVNLNPAGVAPALLGGVYVPTRDATQAADVDTNGGDGRLVVLTATDVLLGGMLEPVKDGTPYERQWNELAQKWEWVKPTATATDYGIGLSYDDTLTPPLVNLQPAGPAANLLGGVWVPPRTDVQGLELSVGPTADGQLIAPPATDLLSGGLTEPPQDGLPYARKYDTTGTKWIWEPTVAAGLQITGLIPDQIIIPSTTITTVHAYGSEFTATCKLFANGVVIPSSAYVSPTEMTFVVDPTNVLAEATLTITVQDLLDPANPVFGAGAEVFTFAELVESLYRGVWLPATNSPDIVTLTKEDQWMWVANTATATIPELPPVAIPGLVGPVTEGDHIVWDATAAVFIRITSPGDLNALVNAGTGLEKVGRTINLQPPGADSTNPLNIGGVRVPDRSVDQGLMLTGDGLLTAPPATPRNAGVILEPEDDGKGYVRTTLNGVSAWVPPADTPLPAFGLGLTHDETTPPGIVNLNPAGVTVDLLGGVWVPTRDATQAADVDTSGGDGKLVVLTATNTLLGGILEPPLDGLPYERIWNELAQKWEWKLATVGPDFGIGLSLDNTPDPDIVNLQPAGDSPDTLGGVYVIDRERNVEEGLELGIDGRLRAPLATPRLAGTIVEPEDDGKGYVRTTLNGVSAWVPPADTPLPSFGIGLSQDDSTDPTDPPGHQIINLQPAADSPAGLGGVYVVERTRTAFQGLELNGDGELKVPPATDLLAGSHTEPPQDGLSYSRKYDPAGPHWVWEPALTPGLHVSEILPDKAIIDPVALPVTVHVFGGHFTATTVVMLDGVDTATTFINQNEVTYQALPAAETVNRTVIVTVKDTAPVPPDTGVGAGADAFEYIVSTTAVDYGTGLAVDMVPTPPIVNVTPAGTTAALLGGVYVPTRDIGQAADVDTSGGDGKLVVLTATDVLLGGMLEPVKDGTPYERQWNETAQKWEWVAPTATKTDYGVGLSYDDTTTPPIVNLQPLGPTANLLGGAWVPPRTATQGLNIEFGAPANGQLQAPLATDLLAGTHTEPPQDGVAHTRKYDAATSLWIWEPALTAGLTITGLIPNKVIIPSTTPVTVHVYGAEFTATTEVLLDGTPVTPVATFVSSTEMTYVADPTLEAVNRTIIVTVREGATIGAGAEAFDYATTTSGLIIADAPPDPLTTPPNTLWWESDTGDLYVLYNDGNSIQWVEAVAGAEPGNVTHIGDTPPAAANPGDLWWDSDAGTLAVYFQDVDSTAWVQISGPMPEPPAGGITDAPSDGTPYNRQDAAWVSATSGGLADAPSDGTEYVRKDAAWVNPTTTGGAFLPLTGGTLTGALKIETGKYLTLDKPLTTNWSGMYFTTGGVSKWEWDLTDNADNMILRRFDAGGITKLVQQVTQSNGVSTFFGPINIRAIDSADPTLSFNSELTGANVWRILGTSGSNKNGLEFWGTSVAGVEARCMNMNPEDNKVNFTVHPVVQGVPVVLMTEHQTALDRIAALEARLTAVEALATQIRDL